jgi:hypothetical protein
VLAGVVALLAVACGGKVQTGGPDQPAADRASDGSAPAMNSGSPGASGRDPAATVALPPCLKGFKMGEAIGKLCVFVTDGLCYETKIDACACACAKPSGTVCLSGFPDPDRPTTVTCN